MQPVSLLQRRPDVTSQAWVTVATRPPAEDAQTWAHRMTCAVLMSGHPAPLFRLV